MNPQATSFSTLTARELRRLTPAAREAALLAAAALAEREYRTDTELTAFEAFGSEHKPALTSLLPVAAQRADL